MIFKFRNCFLFFFLASLALLSLFSCGENGEYSVTFNLCNGEDTIEVAVNRGEYVKMPNDPIREGYIFSGWFLDEEKTVKYDPLTKVTDYIELYAGWELNYIEMVNLITSKSARSVVRIESYFYDFSESLLPDASSAEGSGVIVKKHGSDLLVVTNYHVVSDGDGVDRAEFYVFDCYGNEYKASLLEKDEEKDLAILRFDPKGEDLLVCEIVDLIPDHNEVVATVGHPKGQINAFYLGEIKYYQSLSVGEENMDGSKVDFPVIWHSAPANHGSSGGGVFNSEGKLIGINFATGKDENGDYAITLAIPAKYVQIILDKAVN